MRLERKDRAAMIADTSMSIGGAFAKKGPEKVKEYIESLIKED